MDFKKFKSDLSALMIDGVERPFVCDGHPLQTSVFIVGFNPATKLERDFWSYCDESGFNRQLFEEEYFRQRSKKGNRPRMEAIVSAFPKGDCLETNVFSVPSKRASDLRLDQRRSQIFEYLFRTINPSALYIHSVPAVNFFASINPEISIMADDVPIKTTIMDRDVIVMLRRRKALYTMALEDARRCGKRFAEVFFEQKMLI